MEDDIYFNVKRMQNFESEMNKFNSIVTGGAGFIGSHLVDLLIKKGHRVTVIDNMLGGHEGNLKQHENNSNFHFRKIDINKITKNQKEFRGADFCFHLAGIGDIVPSIEMPLKYMETNVHGTTKILEACRTMG